MGRGCEIVLIDPSSTYVVIKFELAKYFVEKVVQCQKLCNCVNLFRFWKASRQPTGKGRVHLSIFFDGSQPYLCFELELGTYAI